MFNFNLLAPADSQISEISVCREILNVKIKYFSYTARSPLCMTSVFKFCSRRIFFKCSTDY